MQASQSLSPPAQIAFIIHWLLVMISNRGRSLPWTAGMFHAIGERLRRIERDFRRLAALIAAGKVPRDRAVKPRAARDPAAAPDPGADPGEATRRPDSGEDRLFGMHLFGWLVRWLPPLPAAGGAGAMTSALSTLLQTPEMQALLAATPRMGRIVRPLCWMLAVDASLMPPPAPRRPRRPKTPPPLAEAGEDTAAAAPAEKFGLPFVRLQMGPEGSMTYPLPDSRGNYPKGTRRLSRGPGFVCRP